MTLPAAGGAELFQSRKFSEIATEILRERIMSGALAAGSRINEVALADELTISRPPLREALRVLSGEGLVMLVPGKGAYVTDLDLESFVHVAEVRMALEVESARLAALRKTPDDVAALQVLMERLEQAVAGEASSYPHHIEFHAVLAAATHNPQLANSVSEVIRRVRLASMRTNETPQRAAQILDEHSAVVAAVLSGDPDVAAQVMRDHIQANTEATVALLQKTERTESR